MRHRTDGSKTNCRDRLGNLLAAVVTQNPGPVQGRAVTKPLTISAVRRRDLEEQQPVPSITNRGLTQLLSYNLRSNLPSDGEDD